MAVSPEGSAEPIGHKLSRRDFLGRAAQAALVVGANTALTLSGAHRVSDGIRTAISRARAASPEGGGADLFEVTGRPTEEMMHKAIDPFIQAMNYGGVPLDYDQIAKDLTPIDVLGDERPLVDTKGKPYVAAVYTIPEGQALSGMYPLMIAEQDKTRKWVWSEVSRGGLGRKKGTPIGAYVVSWMAMQDRSYAEVLRKDTDHFQLDDLALWNVLEPQQGSINQREFHKIIGAADLSRKFGYTLSVGSGMILGPEWGIPDWLKSMSCSNEDLLAITEQHIETFLTPFQNYSLQRVAVANEMLHHPLGIPNFWTETRGLDRNILLKRAFRKARQVAPDAELALRDFSVEFADYPRSEEFYSLVTQLNAEEMAENGRILIDAVEFQLPLLLDALIGKDPAMDPSNFTNPDNRRQMMEKLRSNIKRFRESGVNVYIVELMLPINSLLGSTTEEKLAQQAAIYADIYKVCMEEGVGIGLTRTNDSTNTTFAYPTDRDTNTLPYPRNDRLEPLPSHFAINQAIFSTNRTV